MSGAKRTSHVDAKLFNVGHIFPLAREQTWIDQNMSRWITDTENPQVQGETKIHSAQNGLLMKADIHALFDGYGVAVNVDVRDPKLFLEEQDYNTTIGWV